MNSVFTKLQEACQRFERENAELVFSRVWEHGYPCGDDVMVRITKVAQTYYGDRLVPTLEDCYTMTCAFMVNGMAMCSVDVQEGTAEQVFKRLADRMLQQ